MGTQSVSEAFRNMGQNILLSLADITFQLLVLEPIIKRVRDALSDDSSGSSGGLGGILGSLFGSSSTIPTLGPETTFSMGGEFVAVPSLADGGIATRPTLAVVGDAGPEIIAPLPRKDLFSQPGVEVNILGGIVPQRPGMTERDVVQIGLKQLDTVGGPWLNTIAQRTIR